MLELYIAPCHSGRDAEQETRCAKFFFFFLALSSCLYRVLLTQTIYLPGITMLRVRSGRRTSRRRIGAGGFPVEEAVVSGCGTARPGGDGPAQALPREGTRGGKYHQ